MKTVGFDRFQRQFKDAQRAISGLDGEPLRILDKSR